MIRFQLFLWWVATTTVTLLLLVSSGCISRAGDYCFVTGFFPSHVNPKPSQQHQRRYQHMRQHQQLELTIVKKAVPDDWFEGIQNFWNSFNGNDSSSSQSISKNNGGDEDDDELADLPAGTSVILKIPVRQLKPGGLRLFLMFCLMGLQNTPTKNTWRANQPVTSPNGSRFSDTTEVVVPLPSSPSDDTDNGQKDHREKEEYYVLEMIHHDMTGTVTIELIPPREENKSMQHEVADDHDHADDDKKRNYGEVRILRSGSNPSNSYLMNESVILDGILDELHKCSFDETIPVSNRLIVPVTSDAIDVAREELAFG